MGHKTIETRGYPPPTQYLGRAIAVVETGRRRRGQVIGFVKITGWKLYRYESEWADDYERHWIGKEDELYGWGSTRRKYGWEMARASASVNSHCWEVRRGGRVWTTVASGTSFLN